MRLFYVIKASQCLAAYAVIILITLNRNLCGESSLDKLLSNPNGSCSNSLESIYMNTLTSVRQSSRSNRGSSKKEVHTLPLDKTKQLEEKTQNIASSTEEKLLRIVSFSCIDINVKDLTCFVWKYADRYTVCDALTGVVISPIIMFIEIVLLTYTMISVRCEFLIPSQKIDLIRTLIHCTTWLASVIIVSYVLCMWEKSWMNFDFKPDIPASWLIAVVTLAVGLISVGLEMFLEGALYMTIKIVPGPDFNGVAERRGNGSPVPGMYGSSNADYEQISGSVSTSRHQVTYVSTAF